MWLNVDGSWKIISVDLNLPFDQEKGELFFSKHKKGDLWVPLVEKCLAKVYGSYATLEFIPYEDILFNFSGAPTETLSIRSHEHTL